MAMRKIPSSRERLTRSSAQWRANVSPPWKPAMRKMDPMEPSIPLDAVQPTLRTEVPSVHRNAGQGASVELYEDPVKVGRKPQ